MKNNLKRILRTLFLLFKVSWTDTLRINAKLPFKQARKLPILLFNSSLKIKDASISLDIPSSHIHFGIIKLGLRHSSNLLSNKFNICLQSGGVIFKGSGIMGNGSSILTRGGIITFGKNFGITGNFQIASETSITIGDNLSSSWDVSIFDTDFHTCSDPITNVKYPSSLPITIGDNVWLCQQVLILKGAILSSWTTVAARTIVNKPFEKLEPYSVIAGIPARVTSKKLRRDDVAVISSLPETWQITRGSFIFSPVNSKVNNE